jgi:Kef-type K+ transport system membrane component KefB
VTEIRAQASLWLGLALLESLLSIRLRIAAALSEIVVGIVPGGYGDCPLAARFNRQAGDAPRDLRRIGSSLESQRR